MSRGNLEKRLALLEEAIAARSNPTLGVVMPDPEMAPEVFLDGLIADGKLAAADRHRVLVVRFWTEHEAEQARVRAEEDAQYGWI